MSTNVTTQFVEMQLRRQLDGEKFYNVKQIKFKDDLYMSCTTGPQHH